MVSPERSNPEIFNQVDNAESRLQLAVQAASEVARSQGLIFDRTVLLQDVSNAIFRLEPTEVVARVATTTGTLRPGDRWFVREVAIARYLTAAGAAIIPVSSAIDPGPYSHLGLVMSFWQYVQVLPMSQDLHQAGQRLRQCHDILKGFKEILPVLGLITEAQEVLNQWIAASKFNYFNAQDAEMLVRIGQRSVDRLQQMPHQPIHGDPHLGNVLNTNLGLLWTDWEDAFMGPIEWDLASMIAPSRLFGVDCDRIDLTLQGYGMDFDPIALEQCVEARTFVALIWAIILQEQHPNVDRRQRIDRRLEWLHQV
jgi:thiamine kinase-like enzyme